jgi:hypothetical protein
MGPDNALAGRPNRVSEELTCCGSSGFLRPADRSESSGRMVSLNCKISVPTHQQNKEEPKECITLHNPHSDQLSPFVVSLSV